MSKKFSVQLPKTVRDASEEESEESEACERKKLFLGEIVF